MRHTLSSKQLKSSVFLHELDCALHASSKQDSPTIYFCLVSVKKYLGRSIYPRYSSILDKLFIDDSSMLSLN